MKTKNRWLMFLLLIGLTVASCRKDHSDPPRPLNATLPGACTAVITHYQGPTVLGSEPGANKTQTISVNADVISHPSDVIDAFLCRVNDCRTNMPTQDCAALLPDVTSPCYRDVPDAHISFGHGTVIFTNASTGFANNQANFDSYKIDTTVCQ